MSHHMQDRVILSSGAQVDAQLVDCSAYVFGAVHISSGEMTSCFHINTPEECDALAKALSDLGKRMRGSVGVAAKIAEAA